MIRVTPVRSRPALMSAPARGRGRAEAGYALLVVMFFAAMMLLAASVAVPRLLTQGRRDKEDEMIWRGEQHVRAIRLYYRKFGRFPKSLEDLSEAKNNIRFLRKPYKDVMNRADGSWRMIYVGPTGQLIGSVTRLASIGLPLAAQNQPPGPQTQPPNPAQRRPPQPLPPDTRPDTQNDGQSPDLQGPQGDEVSNVAPQPIAPPNKAIPGATTVEGQVFGGNLIGIGSKVKQPSLKFYKGYGKYNEWEFIWDPAAEAGVGGVPGAPGNLPPGGQAPQQQQSPPPPQ
jgi:hypothetical protein